MRKHHQNNKGKTCGIKDCTNKARVKGVCMGCYQKGLRVPTEEEITEEEKRKIEEENKELVAYLWREEEKLEKENEE